METSPHHDIFKTEIWDKSHPVVIQIKMYYLILGMLTWIIFFYVLLFANVLTH